jgi:glutathione-specific gamma-glutamylcyclotransferase
VDTEFPEAAFIGQGLHVILGHPGQSHCVTILAGQSAADGRFIRYISDQDLILLYGGIAMLDRDAIRSGAFLRSFGSLPGDLLWTQDQIETSLERTMARRPLSADADVWVFAYGSLMWNPLFRFEERVIATLDGFHRSFCIRLIAGRATPEHPGRMLSLERGGKTEGVVLRMPRDNIREELLILWTREMVTGAYTPIWAPYTTRTGDLGHAIAFVAKPEQTQYEANSHPSVIAPLIARAAGPMGTNAEYVFALRRALADCNITDDYIEVLARELDTEQTR